MRYIIEGPNIVSGEIVVSGAKNFSIKALAASLLQPGIYEYFNVPDNLDVRKTLAMLKALGARVEFDVCEKHCEIDTTHRLLPILEDSDNTNMVIFLLGAAMIHQFEFVKFPRNKGCPLGKRADDFHIMAFEKFGAECIYDASGYIFKKTRELQGCNIVLPYPSVGATETALFLASKASGVSVIENIAIEPEIHALITLLGTMGARMFFAGDRKIVVHGVKNLTTDMLNPGVKVNIHGDLLEAATWAVLAAVTHGSLIVSGCVPESIGSFLGVFAMMGGAYERVGSDSLRFFKNKQHRDEDVFLETGTFPCLRTDLQPLLAALAAMNQSKTMIHETVYNKRVEYVDVFRRFGVDAENFKECVGETCRFQHNEVHSARISRGSMITAPSEPIFPTTIRSGMAKIILAAAARGVSIIENVEIVERGYCNLFNKLRAVGVNVRQE